MNVDIESNTKVWIVRTNRHPTTSGHSWGWIDGAEGNVCWGNDEQFNYKKACELCSEHNQWLESQRPISLRILESKKKEEILMARYLSKQDQLHEAKQECEKQACITAQLELESNAND